MNSAPGSGWAGKSQLGNDDACDCGLEHEKDCDFRLSAAALTLDSASSATVERLATPRSSLSDDREYRVVRLRNGVTAVLVHDPTTEKAAAALAVGVGAYSDPFETPGVAHFLEHMLFQGTKKYPGASEYKKYVASNGGSTNAATSGEGTCFQFDVVEEAFEGALDRFGRFFVEPLLDPEKVDLEMNAVDAEHSKNLQNDGRRAYQMMRLSANQEHSFSKFSTGNLETLKVDGIRDKLLGFYEQHYQPDRMRVGLVSKRPLDDIEKLCEVAFGGIEPKASAVLPPPPPPVPLFKPGEPELIERVPVRELRVVNIVWPLPFAIREDYENGAPRVVSHLLGHEGERSLLSHLKDLGLANSLSAGFSPSLEETSCVSMSIELTVKGDEHRDDQVLPAVFKYLGSLKRESTRAKLESLWDEVAIVARYAFDYGQSKRPAYSMAPQVAQALNHYDPADILVGGSPGLSRRNESALWTDSRQTLYESIFDTLVDPSNLIVHAARPSKKKEEYLKERWYDIEYSRRPLSVEELTRLSDASSSKAETRMGLPGKNEFLPTGEVTLSKDTATAEHAKVPPTKLMSQSEGSAMDVWWKQDGTFGQPKALVSLRLCASDLEKEYDSTTFGVLTRLLTRCIADQLEAPLYEARCSFLSYELATAESGIELGVGGFVGPGFGALWKALLEGILVNGFEAARFERVKEQLARAFRDCDKARADHHASRWRRELLIEDASTLSESLKAVEAATLEDLVDFQRKFLKEARGFLFAHGKLESAGALRLAEQATSILKLDNSQKKKWPVARRVRVMPPGADLRHRQKSPNSAQDVDSAVQYTYHAGSRDDLHGSARIALLCHLIRNEFFAQLRTREQLGYLVSLSSISMRGQLYITMSVQSQRATPEHVAERIENFVQGFDLTSLEDTFEKTRASTITRLLEPDESMHEEYSKWWAALESPDLLNDTIMWDRYELIAEQLKSTTLPEISALYERLLRSESTSRLIVSVAGRDHDDEMLLATLAADSGYHDATPSPVN